MSSFFCGISALLPPEKGMKGHIRRTAAPSSRKRLRSYHRRRLDFYGVLSMLPVHHLPALISSYLAEKKKVPPLQTQCHNLSNNYIKMEHHNDGNFLITREISSALQAKIARVLVTP
jgi:hypothetical protein